MNWKPISELPPFIDADRKILFSTNFVAVPPEDGRRILIWHPGPDSKPTHWCEITPPSDRGKQAVDGPCVWCGCTKADHIADGQTGKLCPVDGVTSQFYTPPIKKPVNIESSLAEALEELVTAFERPSRQFLDSTRDEMEPWLKQARAALAMRQAGGKEGGGE